MPIERNDNLTQYNFSDYTGGINVSLPPMLIGSNDAQSIINMEYDYTRLRTRGGISAPILTFTNDISYIWYDKAVNRYIVIDSEKQVYIADLDGTPTFTGTLNGTFTPSFEKFGGNCFIASGSKLQYIDYADNTLKTIDSSKNCDNVFYRYGRLATSKQGDDNLYYSAIGDPYSTDAWTNNSNDESSSQWLEIGYKDDGDITTCLPLANDLMIFKTQGLIYDLSGESPNWNVQNTNQLAFAVNKDSIKVVENEIIFLTKNGLKNLASTSNYGNFAVNEVGYKFNKLLSASVHNPKMWNIISKRQLIIRPNDNNTQHYFIYQYNMDSGFEVNFGMNITDMAESQTGVIVASGKSIYRWSFDYTSDNGTPISQTLVTRQVLAQDKFFTRRMDIILEGTSGTATIRLIKESFKYKFPLARKVKEIYTNSRYIEVGITSTVPFNVNAILVNAVNV